MLVMSMKRALVVSKTESGLKTIAQLLHDEKIDEIYCTLSSEDAKDKLIYAEYDVIVINTPLSEETGLEFSIYCAEKTKACVIMMVQQEKAMEASNLAAPHGILVIQKPLNRHMFHHYLIFTQCFKERMLSVTKENEELKLKLEEIKIIDRAKLLLMQCLKMSESQAHRYLEKQAMNLRTSKLVVAKQVIKTYEN